MGIFLKMCFRGGVVLYAYIRQAELTQLSEEHCSTTGLYSVTPTKARAFVRRVHI